jgi:hypothetical protein
MSRLGIGLGAAATIACAALTCASCELFYGLDSFTDGSCDANCGEDVSAIGTDAEGDGFGVVLQDSGGQLMPGSGPPDTGSTGSGPPDAGSHDSGAPGTLPPDAGQTQLAPDTGPPVMVGGDAGGSCTCVPAPPVGWSGPLSVWEGGGFPPGCSGDYSAQVLDALADLAAGQAQCTCSCGAATGAACPSSFTATVFSDQGCTTACDSVVVSAGACVDVHGQCANVHGIDALPQAQGGSCKPKASTIVPTAGWGQTARACESVVAPVQSACGPGEVCAPPPAAPMEPRLCVLTQGDVACPGTGYSVKRTVYGGVTDSRGCTPCSCGAPSGVSCKATLQEGCGQTGPVNPVPTTCGGLSDPGSVMLLATLAASGGSCGPVGGVPTGTALPSSPTTVCCMP